MKRTLIAAAILASAASSVYASPPKAYLFNTTGVTDTVAIHGWVRLFGSVTVTSTAGAVINNTQSVSVAGVVLDPNYQSYTKGAITTTFNNEDKNVSVSGSSSFKSSDAQTMTSSWQSSESKSSSHDSHSATAWASGESSQSQSSHTKQSSSSQQDTSASSGHKAVAGVLTVTVAASANESNSHTHTHSGSSASQNFNGSLYVAGAAGVAWDNASSNSNTRDAKSSSSSTSNRSESESGYKAQVHHDDSSSSSSSSKSMQASSSRTTTKSKSWSYTLDVDKTDVTTTGSVTQHIDTRKPGELDAGTGNNAASGVTGNLGVNVAEGISNAQSNDVALASVDIGNVFGNAQIFSSQSSSGKAAVNNFKLNATIGDGSLSSVSGNVGVNVASGVGNVQNNSLAGAVTTVSPTQVSTVAMVATDDNTQTASAQAMGRFEGSATLGANTLHGSAGNIGVNIAGGVGNLQHNGLAIAALNNGH